MDLIYEGITTRPFCLLIEGSSVVRMDLIYEGITTLVSFPFFIPPSSEWTWFTKGLRLEANWCRSKADYYKVRMDLIYEGITTKKWCALTSSIVVRMDLIYEGITTISWLLSSKIAVTSEWTWFTKGLRQLWLSCNRYGPLPSEWTWFTKGLRPLYFLGVNLRRYRSEWTWFTKGLRRPCTKSNIKFFFRQNGPDLRRDYDMTGPCTS